MTDNIIPFGGTPRSPSGRRLIPERLLKARKAKRLSQRGLADEIGVTRQAVSAFEQGERHPEGPTMVRIAAVLEQPLSYFLAEVPPPPGPFSARFFRAFGAETKRRNEQCEVYGEWLASSVSYLSSLVNFPEAALPQRDPASPDGYDEEEIEEAATELRRAWGLGDGPIGNLVKLAESKGVFVSRLPIPEERVNAFSYWSGGVPFVFLGADDVSAVRARYDVAHELGHLVLHRGVETADLEDRRRLKRIETEANRFAGAFLLPRQSYPNEVFSTRLDSFRVLKERWKVAISAQVHRCSDLGLFTEHQTLNVYKQISARKWRKWEPLDNELPIEQPAMLGKALSLLVNSKTASADQVAGAININRKVITTLCNVRSETLESGDPPEAEPTMK